MGESPGMATCVCYRPTSGSQNRIDLLRHGMIDLFQKELTDHRLNVYLVRLLGTMVLRNVGTAIAVPVGCFSEADQAFINTTTISPLARSTRQDFRDDLQLRFDT
jgi:hypothetical protein